MAFISLGAIAVGGILAYLSIGALANLAVWVSVAGALGIGALLTYNIIENGWFEFLPFDSELVEALSAAIFCSFVIAPLSFKLLQSLFVVAGLGFVILGVVLLGASVWLGPFFVGRVVTGLIQFVYDIVRGA